MHDIQQTSKQIINNFNQIQNQGHIPMRNVTPEQIKIGGDVNVDETD
jgi:hypothetical protein